MVVTNKYLSHTGLIMVSPSTLANALFQYDKIVGLLILYSCLPYDCDRIQNIIRLGGPYPKLPLNINALQYSMKDNLSTDV